MSHELKFTFTVMVTEPDDEESLYAFQSTIGDITIALGAHGLTVLSTENEIEQYATVEINKEGE